MWDLKGQLVARFPLDFEPHSLTYSPDGRHLVVGEGSLWQLFDIVGQRKLLTGIAFRHSRDWAVYSPDCHYDGTPGGLAKAILRQGDQVTTLSTLDWHNHRSGLLPASLR